VPKFPDDDMSLTLEEQTHYEPDELIVLERDGKTYPKDCTITCDQCHDIWPSHDHPVSDYGICDECYAENVEEEQHRAYERWNNW